MSAEHWDRAAAIIVAPNGRRRPAMVALPAREPTVEELFEFMRDAELRFETLQMRLDERVAGAVGESARSIDILVEHPGRARVRSSLPELGTARNYELWISDGETVRTFSGMHGVATTRPLRRGVVGTDGADLPGRSRTYHPLTVLPAESIADTMVHPSNYCQNVLATGHCRIAGTGEVAGRAAVFVTCDHPRTVEIAGDRPDYRVTVGVDRTTGLISSLEESMGGLVTHAVAAVSIDTDAPIPPGSFEISIPSDARSIF